MMKTYLVTYSFMERLSEDALRHLRETLNSCGTPWDFFDPVCDRDCTSLLLRSDKEIDEIGRHLINCFGPSDKLLVMQVALNKWFGLTNECAIRHLGPGKIDRDAV